MKTSDSTWLSAQFRWLLVALAGFHAGCGPSAKAPEPDSPSTSSGDSTGATDDSPSDDSSPTASSPISQRDAATPASTTHRDGGLMMGAATDAAVARTADAATVLDASASDSARDAASASGIDAALHEQDAAPHQTDAAQPADAQVDAATAHVVKVDSKDEWTASGFQVQAGKCYTITTKIDDRWLDLDVPADLSGWIDKSDFRFALFSPFRRVVQDDIGFYQFAACVDKKLDQCFPVGANSNVCPKSSGELDFFLNDVPGAESNNVGTATVTIQAK